MRKKGYCKVEEVFIKIALFMSLELRGFLKDILERDALSGIRQAKQVEQVSFY